MMSLNHAIFALFYLVVASAAFGAISAAPWVPTKKKQRQKLVAELDVPQGGTVYDLGCGDGTVLFEIARKRPDIRAIGYEISLLPYAIGAVRKILGGAAYRNVTIKCRNFFRQDVSDADTVFVFLLAKSYERLMSKLRRELKDDCVVVAEAWPMPRLAPAKAFIGDPQILPMYFYKGSQFRE